MSESVANLETSRSPTQTNSQPAQQSGESRQPVANESDAKPRSLRDIFKSADDFDESETHSSEDGNEDGPVESFDQLTKRLKLDPEAAYNIRVPMPNGAEPLTIGQLKDRIGELVTHEQEVLKFDQRRVKAEGDLLIAQTEMRDMLSMLPPEAIKPEMVKKYRQQTEARMAREQELTLEHIPAWQDQKVFREESTAIKKHLQRWGFPEAFFDTITDHRAMKFIRDSWKRDVRIEKALASVKDVPNKGGKSPSAKANKAPRKSGNEQSRRQAPVTQRDRLSGIFNKG